MKGTRDDAVAKFALYGYQDGLDVGWMGLTEQGKGSHPIGSVVAFVKVPVVPGEVLEAAGKGGRARHVGPVGCGSSCGGGASSAGE